MTERRDEMVQEIMEDRGHRTFSEVVGAAIELYYDEVAKSKFYRMKGVKGPSSQAVERRKAEAEENVKLMICQDLKGKIVKKEDGTKMCKYYTYVGRRRYEQEVSLNLLEEHMVASQYTPSRANVERLQEEGKVDYEVDKK